MPVQTIDTGTLPCPYIEGETTRFLLHAFAPSSQRISRAKLNRQQRAFKLKLVKAGFFNQSEAAGQFACPSCRKCFSAAINIDKYKPSKSQRKALKQNSDISFSISEPFTTCELYDLLMDYLKKRHPESNMRQFSFEQFRDKVFSTLMLPYYVIITR